MDDISFINEDGQIMLVVACHDTTESLDEKSLATAFAHSPFYAAYCSPQDVTELLALGNEHIQGVREGELSPSEFTHKYAEIRDAQITVTISADKMSARVKVEMPWGGKSVNIDSIKAACKDAGIKFGLKRSKVESLLSKTFDAEPGTVLEETVAIGKDPKHGKNAYFRSLVELFSDKIRRPMETEGGKVDLKDLGKIETVKPGERVYKKFPLTLGEPGKNVLGEVLPASPGKDAELEVSSGTVIAKDDANILLANREGLARLTENRMEVDDVYTLLELTPKQGHVTFNGSVVIAGDVSPDMKILATGDVVIGGFVQSASIRCKGELTVVSGASGKALSEPQGTRKHNCLLESSSRINIAFANQVDVISKREVLVNKQLSHCQVLASSLVVGQGKLPRGKLVGGEYELSKYLVAGSIGASSGIETHISLNRTYEVFKQKEDALWEKIEPFNLKLEQLKQNLSQSVDSNERQNIKAEMEKIQNWVEKQTAMRKRLIERRKDYMSKVHVTANQELFQGVTVKVDSKSKTTDRELGPSIVKLDEYQLVIDPKTS